MTERLVATGVRVRHGRRIALEDVSLGLRSHQLAVLVGPNGSGKTSLLEVLLGSLHPERGEVRLDSQPLGRTPPKLRARALTLVPQAIELRFDFSVEHVVELGRGPWLGELSGLAPSDRRAVDEALALTNTSELRSRSLHELSAGERQRVQLARALAQQPQVLLLDEPTANLDACHQLELLAILRQFAARGGAVLMAVHDLGLAARHADRVLVLDRGRLVADGPPGEALGAERVLATFGVHAGDTVPAAAAARDCRAARANADGALFVIGGARSGKSRFAAELARSLAPSPVYLATSRVDADDGEHRRRIERHRAERGPEWTTIEEERWLSRPLLEGRVVVVDCLTLWLANCFADARSGDAADAFERALGFAKAELDTLLSKAATWILISNEIGQGVHAMTELGRQFTDLQGFLNQHAAARAGTVVQMVAGLPHLIKGELSSWQPELRR